MKIFAYPPALLACLLLAAPGSRAQGLPKGVALRVVIIRHGNKNDAGDNLSCAGQQRALNLPPVLRKLFDHKPDYTYVPRIGTGKKTTSVRMFQTVTPYAIRENLTIDSEFMETDSTKAAAAVLGRKGQVLMVWEHGNIPPLGRALGLPIPYSYRWDSTDYDTIWIIDYTRPNSSAPAKMLKWTKSKEGLNKVAVCPK